MIWGIEGRHAWFPPDGSGVLRTNTVLTPNPDLAIGLWSGAAGFWNAAGATTRSVAVTPPLGLPACVRVVTAGAANVEGCRISANVVKGVTYRVSAYVRGAVGGEPVQMRIGDSSGASAQTGFAARSAAFTRVFVTYTANETGVAQLAFTGPEAKVVQTFYVAAALVEVATLYRPYFPTPGQLILKRAAFTGTSYESPSTTEAPALTLNLLSDDAKVPVWPRLSVKRVSGLHSLGDAEDRRDLAVRRVGEIPRLSYRRGKTVTYEGWLRARSLFQLREADVAFRAAFADESAEGRMEVSPHPLNPEFTGVPLKQFTARSLGAEIIDSQDTSSYERRFLVAVRLSDPRYFNVDLTQSATVTTATTGTAYDLA